VIANIERAANLFLTKNVHCLLLALMTIATAQAYPITPVQMTLISTVTVGVPGFFLALGPSTRRYVPGFLRRVLLFSLPVGVVIGAAAYAGYTLARWLEPGRDLVAARSTTTVVVLVVALWTLGVLARPLAPWKVALLLSMAGLVALVTAVPALGAHVFLLHPAVDQLLLAVAVGAGGCVLVEVVSRGTARWTTPRQRAAPHRQSRPAPRGAHERIS
jgi:cation-transporting ATPase E